MKEHNACNAPNCIEISSSKRGRSIIVNWTRDLASFYASESKYFYTFPYGINLFESL